MQVLFDARVLAGPNPSGVALYGHHLLEALLRQHPDVEFTIYNNRYNNPTTPELVENFPNAHPLTTTYPNKLLTLGWRFFDFPSLTGRLKGIDLIHSPHMMSLHATTQPQILTVHDLSFEKFSHLLSFKERLWHHYQAGAARRAAHFIASSHATKQDLMTTWRIPASRISVIYPGMVDSPAAYPPATVDGILTKFQLTQSRYLLYIGDLTHRKNLVRLVRSFAKVSGPSGNNDLKLVLAGKPDNAAKNLRQTIHQLQMQDKVILTGYIDTLTKHILLKNAHAFCYLSLYEGFGLPLLEAMEAELPILASNLSAIPEVTGNAALLVDPYDEKAIAEGLEAVVGDNAQRNNLVECIKGQKKHFTWETAASKVLTVYQQAVSAN